MTEQPTPITDEDLSAHLDGQGAPDLAARIAGDPAAQARLAALSASARLLADEPVAPLDPSVVDALVGRALDAMPESFAAAGPDQPVTTTDPNRATASAGGGWDNAVLDEPTPRTAHRVRRLPPTWLVAAAVVLLVALGIGLVATGGKGDRTQQTATASTTTVAPGGAPNEATGDAAGRGPKAGRGPAADNNGEASPLLPDHGAAPAPGATPDGGSSSSSKAFGSVPLVDLGTFPSPDALRTALAARFPDEAATATTSDVPSTRVIQRCGTQLTVTLDLDQGPTHLGYGMVDGQSVLVYEFPATSYTDQTPTTLVAAVGAASCDPVVTFQR